MTAHLSREETEALLLPRDARAVAREQEVSVRDFHRPHRLSKSERGRLARAVSGALPALERALEPWLREGLALELDEIAEVSALGLFDELVEPFVVQSLASLGQPCWIVVSNEIARALAGSALGLAPSADVDSSARKLSPIEAGLVGDLLIEVASGIARALELDLAPGMLLQETRPLRLSLGADLAREAQRMAVHVTLTGKALPTTTFRIYLPCVAPPSRANEHERSPARPLPEHLAGVMVDVTAQLGSIDVPLSDLLALEVGDVVPLGVGAGEGTTIFVEERPCGRAQWGNHEGGLALRILDFEPPEED